jgi:hypothetical protein
VEIGHDALVQLSQQGDDDEKLVAGAALKAYASINQGQKPQGDKLTDEEATEKATLNHVKAGQSDPSTIAFHAMNNVEQYSQKSGNAELGPEIEIGLAFADAIGQSSSSQAQDAATAASTARSQWTAAGQDENKIAAARDTLWGFFDGSRIQGQ